MNFAHQGKRRLDPAEIRLPLIALIDVILFLLMYFIFAGSLEAMEAELATAIRTERRSTLAAKDLDIQYIDVVMEGGTGGAGRPEFRIGSHRLYSREELVNILKDLPNSEGAVLRVDDDVPVAAAAAAAQACKDTGFTKVSYLPRGRRVPTNSPAAPGAGAELPVPSGG